MRKEGGRERSIDGEGWERKGGLEGHGWGRMGKEGGSGRDIDGD
jgi:hypothetical protein